MAYRLFRVLMLGALLSLVFYFFGSPLSSVSMKIFSPAIRIYNNFSNELSLGFDILKPKSLLLSENNSLKDKISELEAENVGLETNASQSNMLYGSYSFKDAKDMGNFIGATILSSPPRTPYDTLIIDRGASDGVKIGDNVYSSPEVEVGKIESVYDNESRVRLFSSSEIKTESILERTGEIVELQGFGDFSFKLSLPLSSDIKVGDLFVLPGLPRIAIAEVKAIKTDDKSSFESIFLSIPVSINGNSLLYINI